MRRLPVVLVITLAIFAGHSPGHASLPADTSSRGPVVTDLLKLVLQGHERRFGLWETKGGMLRAVASKEATSRVQLPFHPADPYELRVVVEHRSGPSGILIGLVMAGHPFMVELDGGKTKDIAGLTLDGKPAYLNGTSRQGKLIERGKPATVRCSVRKGRVIVRVDGARVIDWEGKPGRLSLPASWQVSDSRRPFVGCRGGEHHFTKISIADSLGKVVRTSEIRRQYEAQLRRERRGGLFVEPDRKR